MTARSKLIVLVLVIQSGFLVMGSWIHQRFDAAALHRAARDRAWSALESTAETILLAWRDRSTDLEPGADALGGLRRLWTAGEGQAGDLLIVDRQWRPVSPVPEAGVSGTSIGHDAVTWVQQSWPDSEGSTPMRGLLTLPDGVHLAAAIALQDPPGYAVFHRPIAAVEAQATTMVGSRSLVSVLVFAWTGVLMAIAVYMVLARFQDRVQQHQSQAADRIQRQSQSLIRTRDAVIFGLAKLADSRDPETGDHLERISAYSVALAGALRDDPRFKDQVTAEFVRLIGISAALHDIGKVGIEDSILRKAGPLTPDQRKRMETHTAIGGECLRGIERRLGGSNFLQMAREITLAHHERWDGTGYPNRLAEEAIPLSARIVAVADVYDALASTRIYKERYDHQQCLAYITGQAGKHFDPHIVEVWQGIESRFRAIAKRWTDRSTPAAVHVEFADHGNAEKDARSDEAALAEIATDI
ncbi:MAG: HD domain-containing protein [bacterium]|nr:HD domain-containing protein [bacterium]